VTDHAVKNNSGALTINVYLKHGFVMDQMIAETGAMKREQGLAVVVTPLVLLFSFQ
jgi:hypothetical protein